MIASPRWAYHISGSAGGGGHAAARAGASCCISHLGGAHLGQNTRLESIAMSGHPWRRHCGRPCDRTSLRVIIEYHAPRRYEALSALGSQRGFVISMRLNSGGGGTSDRCCDLRRSRGHLYGARGYGVGSGRKGAWQSSGVFFLSDLSRSRGVVRDRPSGARGWPEAFPFEELDCSARIACTE